ncbi:hypothetical protein Fmac_025344 [Flemingia macrophylla]|uniref:Uncharacterized protein n=1 Tax=Flemingia macrophylla TaxID=520843 RepID=A0ABD1LS46_9FABA
MQAFHRRAGSILIKILTNENANLSSDSKNIVYLCRKVPSHASKLPDEFLQDSKRMTIESLTDSKEKIFKTGSRNQFKSP